jgi:hypothetical protein
MGQTPGDDKQEPSLELPSLSLPAFGRRKRAREQSEEQAPVRPPQSQEQPGTPEAAPDDTAAALDEPTRPLETPGAGPAPEPRRRAATERTERALPSVPGRVAAAVTGLVVGGAGAGATYAALTACEAVRGVSTCGGSPGFFILVAILALMILLGSLLLKALKVSDPGSTSFLAVGIVTVVVMLTLLDAIYSPWMFVVVPALSALAYLLAHWVTTRFEDESVRQ